MTIDDPLITASRKIYTIVRIYEGVFLVRHLLGISLIMINMSTESYEVKNIVYLADEIAGGEMHV